MNPTDLKDLLSRGRGKTIVDFLHTGHGKTVLIVGLIIVAFALGHYWPTSEESKLAPAPTSSSCSR